MTSFHAFPTGNGSSLSKAEIIHQRQKKDVHSTYKKYVETFGWLELNSEYLK